MYLHLMEREDDVCFQTRYEYSITPRRVESEQK